LDKARNYGMAPAKHRQSARNVEIELELRGLDNKEGQSRIFLVSMLTIRLRETLVPPVRLRVAGRAWPGVPAQISRFGGYSSSQEVSELETAVLHIDISVHNLGTTSRALAVIHLSHCRLD